MRLTAGDLERRAPTTTVRPMYVAGALLPGQAIPSIRPDQDVIPLPYMTEGETRAIVALFQGLPVPIGGLAPSRELIAQRAGTWVIGHPEMAARLRPDTPMLLEDPQ